MLFGNYTEDNDEVVAVDGTTGRELWRKSQHNLAVSLWAGDGLYSTYSQVFRWF
jgi:hypothetical protein